MESVRAEKWSGKLPFSSPSHVYPFSTIVLQKLASVILDQFSTTTANKIFEFRGRFDNVTPLRNREREKQQP